MPLSLSNYPIIYGPQFKIDPWLPQEQQRRGNTEIGNKWQDESVIDNGITRWASKERGFSDDKVNKQEPPTPQTVVDGTTGRRLTISFNIAALPSRSDRSLGEWRDDSITVLYAVWMNWENQFVEVVCPLKAMHIISKRTQWSLAELSVRVPQKKKAKNQNVLSPQSPNQELYRPNAMVLCSRSQAASQPAEAPEISQTLNLIKNGLTDSKRPRVVVVVENQLIPLCQNH